jgi:hypothetical protein
VDCGAAGAGCRGRGWKGMLGCCEFLRLMGFVWGLEIS